MTEEEYDVVVAGSGAAGMTAALAAAHLDLTVLVVEAATRPPRTSISSMLSWAAPAPEPTGPPG